MEGVRPLTAARAVGLAALLAAGCASHQTRALKQSVTRAVEAVSQELGPPPAPATHLDCVWQKRLTPLPDPTKEGMLTPGLAGQMFLISADGRTADVAGDVTVAVYDETPRPNGGQPHTPEVWHFTADVLKKMVTNDERFGRSYVLFLPWLPEWRDVTAVRILTRYDAPGSTTLHSGEARIALDLTGQGTPAWTESANAGQPPLTEARLVPDGAKLLQQVQAGGAAGAAANVQPAVAAAPQPEAVPIVEPIIIPNSLQR